MFARKGVYSAAFTNKTPSRDPELRLLLEWIAAQPGDGLLIVGPLAGTIEHTPLGADLVRRNQAAYRSERQWSAGSVPGGRVIALWPDEVLLRKLHDRVPDRGAMGVLAWNQSDVSTWAAGVGALDLLGGATVGSVSVSDDVTVGALRSLTNSVNLGTGIAHPMDRDKAIETLEILRRTGRTLEAGAIEAWAIANGWGARHAADLSGIAADIARGVRKRRHSKRPIFVDGIVDIWRQRGSELDWEPT